ncbi:16S rRNA (guanine(527)-N(7))-methyltransferase RsmG [candidate division KSB1 bacterium]|nr:16S rRNA (guanine(527)-N(7))-methyltransferase RsmG [candidate division KSB1 bacterium]
MMIDTQIDYLKKKLEESHFKISEKQIDQFKLYLIQLLQWNKKTNLISKKDESVIISRHFLESISLLEIFQIPENSKLIDVGSGGGFPGVPIKIMRPDLYMTLLDSKRFRFLFLNELVSKLDLTKIKVLKERAEILSVNPEFSKKYDFVIARAVTQLDKLYLWTHQFLKSEGSILTFKGGKFHSEMERVKKIYKTEVRKFEINSSLVNSDRELFLVQLI